MIDTLGDLSAGVLGFKRLAGGSGELAPIALVATFGFAFSDGVSDSLVWRMS
jgi:hypothetical protein